MKVPPPMMPANSGRGSTIQGMLVLGSGGREGRENVAMTPLSWMADDLPQTGPLGGETPLSSAQVSDAKSRTETTSGVRRGGGISPARAPKSRQSLASWTSRTEPPHRAAPKHLKCSHHTRIKGSAGMSRT